MNKNAIKKFAIEARKKLIDSVTDKAGMLGITEKSCSEPIAKGADFEVYQTTAGTEVTLNKRQCEQRRRLVSQIETRGFEAVVEEVAYTWFNRICAIRFMEVNDYLPNRVRVLSSEKEGKLEPDLVTLAPDVDLDLTVQDKEEIISWKMSGTSEDTDKLYCKLFLKQCHQLHAILPGLFEADSDYMELLFGISYTNKDDVIYMLVNPETGIPEADFNVSTLDEEGNPTGQVEIIGWLYQYYNTELKDDTFAKLKKNIKITKERIPAATQLFTPDWIVRYMVENSVGRIWIEHLRAVDPSTDEKATAERFGWKYYLPEAEQEEFVNVKLAEIRTAYKDLKPMDITCIDPCMGSGHILITMFDVLMDIYESAGYDKREAAFEIVEHNLHGLDIDQRAYQLAYFAVMMKGRGYNRRFLRGRDGKPEPKVYAIAESNEINRNHLQFFGTHLSEQERDLAVTQMEGLLDTFKDAREYGSILNVDDCDWDVLEKFVEDLDADGQISFESVGSEETQEALRKLVKVARNLEQKYDVVVTNPPYMRNRGMNSLLLKIVKKEYEAYKADMYAVFIKKVTTMLKYNGVMSMITQHSFMFLSSFLTLREDLYKMLFENLVHLGTKAFEEIGGEVVQTATFTVRNVYCNDFISRYKRLVQVDNAVEKENAFHNEENDYSAKQDLYKVIPGMPIAYWASKAVIDVFNKSKKLGDVSEPRKGNSTSNNDRFLRFWHEVSEDKLNLGAKKIDKNESHYKRWYPYNKGGSYRKWYGNNEYVVDWKDDAAEMRAIPSAVIANYQHFMEPGITWSTISGGQIGVRRFGHGFIFDNKGESLFADSEDNLNYYAGFLNSNVAMKYLEFLSPTLDFNCGYIARLPILQMSQDDKENVIEMVKENVQIMKDDWDSYEQSWDFVRSPLIDQYDTLEESYQAWVKKSKQKREILKRNEERINFKFIELYQLQEEMSAEVKEESISLKICTLTEACKAFVSYFVGCMFGRYSIDYPGLICSGDILDTRIYEEYLPDEDNCIPITDEEYFSDDIVGRFVEFVKTVYGVDTLEENLDFIANALGNKGDTSREVIRNYFLKDFYADHLKVYQKRPIYWLFDSGKQNGFKALIYMHRYDADTVGRVRTDYLHRAQKYVETAMQSAQYTIDNATSASEKSKATKAVTKYTKQLAEMKIYDEAIAHIANKRIEIDLDDGVKVNYAKFQGVEVVQEGKKALKVDLLAKLK